MSRLKDHYDEQIRAAARDKADILDADYQYDQYLKSLKTQFMKRHLLYYNNGLLEQVSEVNATLEHQVNNGIISFIVDTQMGTVLGKSNNPQLPAQWFEIPSAPEPEKEAKEPVPGKEDPDNKNREEK